MARAREGRGLAGGRGRGLAGWGFYGRAEAWAAAAALRAAFPAAGVLEGARFPRARLRDGATAGRARRRRGPDRKLGEARTAQAGKCDLAG